MTSPSTMRALAIEFIQDLYKLLIFQDRKKPIKPLCAHSWISPWHHGVGDARQEHTANSKHDSGAQGAIDICNTHSGTARESIHCVVIFLSFLTFFFFQCVKRFHKTDGWCWENRNSICTELHCQDNGITVKRKYWYFSTSSAECYKNIFQVIPNGFTWQQ